MSRASDAGNGIMRAVIDYCHLYRVPFFRMQSRTFQVVGAQAKTRPMFTGEWTDLDGQVRRKGMADLLLMPQVTITIGGLVDKTAFDSLPEELRKIITATYEGRASVTVPLWVECKAGAGKLTPDQQKFKAYVEAIGAYYLLVENNPEILLYWLTSHGVVQNVR